MIPRKLDAYDSVTPRPSIPYARWLLDRSIEHKVRSFIAGEVYRPKLDPRFHVMSPVPALRRDGRWGVKCPFYGSITGCDFVHPSGLVVQQHVQRVHLSRNDRSARVRGTTYLPRDWYPEGRITDIAGRRETLNRRAYETEVRARPSERRNALRLARKLP